MSDTKRTRARELARSSLLEGSATGWFESLYRESAAGHAVVPWDDRRPNPMLVKWLDEHAGRLPSGAHALDVGCGTGDNTAELVRRGFRATGFDVSSTAVEIARERFGMTAGFVVADALVPPSGWLARFDLVVEVYTLQVLPSAVRARAARRIADCVAPGGTLLIIARGRDPDDAAGDMPWPLTRGEIESVASDELVLESFTDTFDTEDPPVRRFIATLRRAL